MDNTLENKEKFFAQYWGQKVMYNHIKNGFLCKANPLDCSLKNHLKLKSLINIKDDTAIEVAILANIGAGVEGTIFKIDRESTKGIVVESLLKGKVTSKCYIGIGYNINFFKMSAEISDYLRSKGYALPYMGLSVEKQIEYGWVKALK